MKILRVIPVALILFLVTAPALASVITNSLFQGTVRVTENGSGDAAAVSVNFTLSSSGLIDNNFANDSLTDVAVHLNGTDTAFMPSANSSYPWCMWVPSISAGQNINFDLYTGNVTGGRIRYFPADGGMTTPDDATLEIVDNFTIEQKGWVNTDNNTDKNLVYKPSAFRTWITADEEITSAVTNRDDNYLDFVRANSDWVSIPDDPAFSFTDGDDTPFSILAWVNFDDATDSAIVAKYNIAGNDREWWFRGNGSDHLEIGCFKVDDATTYIGRRTDAITAYQGGWIRVAATYDGSETSAGFNLYIDGVDADTSDFELGAYTGMTGAAEVVNLGSKQAGGNDLLDGSLAEVIIYDVELTPSQVSADYNGVHKATDMVAYYKIDEGAGNPQDSSGNGHHATANLADWTAGFLPWVGGGASVTATDISSGNHTVKTSSVSVITFTDDNYISITAPLLDFADGDTWSVDGWFYHTAAPVKDINTFMGMDTYYGLFFRLGAVNTYQFRDEADNYYVFLANAAAYNEVWTHLAWVCNGTTVILYINGGAGITVTPSTTALKIYRIGASHNTGNFCYEGDFADTRVYNRVLTTAEIEDYEYSTSGLVGHWKIEEGAGATVADISASGYTGTITNAVWGTEALKLSIDDNLKDVGVTAAVPDNANDWAFLQNGSMLYMESHEIIIGGTQAQYIEWEYDNVFTDQSANSNDATPTFRTTSSDADVSAELISFGPVTQAEVATFTLGGITDILTGTPDAITQLYTELDFTYMPGSDVVNTILDEGDIPRALWWFPFLFIGIAVVGMLTYGASTLRVSQGRVSSDSAGTGSLLAMCIVIEVLLALFGVMNPIPFWPALLFPIPAVAIMVSQKHWSWG